MMGGGTMGRGLKALYFPSGVRDDRDATGHPVPFEEGGIGGGIWG